MYRYYLLGQNHDIEYEKHNVRCIDIIYWDKTMILNMKNLMLDV